MVVIKPGEKHSSAHEILVEVISQLSEERQGRLGKLKEGEGNYDRRYLFTRLQIDLYERDLSS